MEVATYSKAIFLMIIEFFWAQINAPKLIAVIS